MPTNIDRESLEGLRQTIDASSFLRLLSPTQIQIRRVLFICSWFRFRFGPDVRCLVRRARRLWCPEKQKRTNEWKKFSFQSVTKTHLYVTMSLLASTCVACVHCRPIRHRDYSCILTLSNSYNLWPNWNSNQNFNNHWPLFTKRRFQNQFNLKSSLIYCKHFFLCVLISFFFFFLLAFTFYGKKKVK